MPIEVNLYDTNTMLGVFRELEPTSNYFLNLCFPSQVNFDDEYIDFEKVSEERKLAPLVVPTNQGRPMYSDASVVTRLKPAYIKPKDPVTPGRTVKRRPGEALLSSNNVSPAQRYNSIIADILRTHSEGIDRRLEHLASQAIISGQVILQGEDYPTRVVDFGRDPSHSVTLTGTAAWNSPSFDGSRQADLQSWISRVRRAKFGGPVSRVTVGSAVLEFLLKDEEIQKQLDLQTRGTNASLNTGLRTGDYAEFVGMIGPNVELWTNDEYYVDSSGNPVRYLGENELVLTGPNVNGVRAFGAIMDARAGFQALSKFPKMWQQEDPSATFVMTQSAPLMIPVNPNQTLRAIVLN